jgi:DNA-binding transcriptional LysR family regulator
MIFREAEDVVAELAHSNAEPVGLLRVAAPNDYGTSTVAPLAAAFTRMYPGCGVDLVLSDTKIDLVANQVDLSIRVGWLEDSSQRARRIGSFRQLLVGSPDLAATLAIDNPEQLASAPFIANSALREPLVWRFVKNDLEQPLVVRMRAVLSIDATPAVAAATLAGGGFSILPDFAAAEHLRTGQLVQILPSWSLPVGGIHAVYPAARFRPSKVSTFVAMLFDAAKAKSL